MGLATDVIDGHAGVRGLYGERTLTFESSAEQPSKVFKQVGRTLRDLGNPVVIASALNFNVETDLWYMNVVVSYGWIPESERVEL